MPDHHANAPFEKALALNLDRTVYGTFAEIGAGQETANWFFKVGASSGTVAKTMSAYDMTFSDEVYGKADRYVSRDRLKQMLACEFDIIVERLDAKRGEDSTFFSFANTVRARAFNDPDSSLSHGWVGIRFQATPRAQPQELLAHVRMWDDKNIDQQEALGIFGVNLIHAAFHLREQPLDVFVTSLLDGIDRHRIEVDMLRLDGDTFCTNDNRLCALQLVESRLTDATIFNSHGEVLQPAEELYKRPLLIQRGSFDPVTRTNLHMMETALRQFSSALSTEDSPHVEIMEISMRNLLTDSHGQIDKTDFLLRADALQACGKTVLVSNFARFHSLATNLSHYTQRPIGIVLGLPLLEEIFVEKWYEDLDGGILEALGRLFKHRVRLYIYPSLCPETDGLLDATHADVPQHLSHLFRYLVENGHIISLLPANMPSGSHTSSQQIRQMIVEGADDWKSLVPKEVLPLYFATQ